ncbi:MAG: hypothetical protein ABH950_04210 [Candidatus Altiarchaeota archaeon]
MAAKKEKSPTKEKKTSKKLTEAEKEARKAARELSSELDLSSKVLDEDIKNRHHILKDEEDLHPEGRKNPKLFYRHFVMRCVKCKEEMGQGKPSHYPPNQLICGCCNEVHRVRVDSKEKHFEVNFPDSLEIIQDLSEKKPNK